MTFMYSYGILLVVVVWPFTTIIHVRVCTHTYVAHVHKICSVAMWVWLNHARLDPGRSWRALLFTDNHWNKYCRYHLLICRTQWTNKWSYSNDCHSTKRNCNLDSLCMHLLFVKLIAIFLLDTGILIFFMMWSKWCTVLHTLIKIISHAYYAYDVCVCMYMCVCVCQYLYYCLATRAFIG